MQIVCLQMGVCFSEDKEGRYVKLSIYWIYDDPKI
jgi:hypothetical protein